ncbi:MAG: hypothetical protein ACLGJB_26090 [Blastocatellia bacterium]
MDNEQEPKGEQPGAEQPASAGQPGHNGHPSNGGGPEPTLRFRFNDEEYEWPCKGYEDRPLKDALAIVRESVGLNSSIELKIRIRPGDLLIDQEMEIASVLSQIADDRHLVISIRNLGELSDPPSGFAKPSKKVSGESLKAVPPVVPKAKIVKKHVLIEKESPVYSVADDRVELPLDLLHLLKGSVEDSLAATFITLFLGAFLGAVLSLPIALLDGSLDAATKGLLWGAFSASCAASLFLGVIQVVVVWGQKKRLAPILEKLPPKTRDLKNIT